LYETLLSMLTIQGFYNVYAGVTVPNKKSELLHSNLGFEEIGIFKNIGFKSGAWHDVKWFQKSLQEYIINPALPLKLEELKHSIDFQTILSVANNKLMKT
ncbi:MAG: GNAT family N-acetyltransferase, partial [Saprospiraceae bacterium]